MKVHVVMVIHLYGILASHTPCYACLYLMHTYLHVHLPSSHAHLTSCTRPLMHTSPHAHLPSCTPHLMHTYTSCTRTLMHTYPHAHLPIHPTQSPLIPNPSPLYKVPPPQPPQTVPSNATNVVTVSTFHQ